MGTNVPERQKYRTDRTPEGTAGYATLRTRGNHQNDSRSQNLLVAKHQ